MTYTILSWLLILSPLILIAIHFALKRRSTFTSKKINPCTAYVLIFFGFITPIIIVSIKGMICKSNGEGEICNINGFIMIPYILFIAPLFIIYSAVFFFRLRKNKIEKK